MKKYLIPTLASLLALAACTKVAPVAEPQREISFQVANYVQTKANVKFENADFGTYAWYTGEAAADQTAASKAIEFMINEKVGPVTSGEKTDWRTVNNTFYWPKTGKLDFISYSPYATAAPALPAITENTITYTGYAVGELNENQVYTPNDVDLMYADKAVGKQANEGTYSTISGTNGVPTLFHHALAHVSFKIQANFLEYTDNSVGASNQATEDQAAGNKTTWKITVKSAELGGIYTKGNLKLDLNPDNGQSWDKPADNVWTDLAEQVPFKFSMPTATETTDGETAAAGIVLKADEATDLGTFGYVIPQKLADQAQTLTLVMDIYTEMPNGVSFTQENVKRTVELSKTSSIKSWAMNQKIVYTILVKPTYGTDPDNPGDPTDDIITFDPAVEDWEPISTATIQI